jgi:DNA polymerase IV
VTRDVTLPNSIADAETIRAAARECLKRVDLVRRIRLLGVRVGTLMRTGDKAADETASSGKALGRGVETNLSLFD